MKSFILYNYEDDTPAYTWANARNETEYAEMWNDNSRVYGRFQALYDRQFGRHNVSAMVGSEVTSITNAMVGASRYYGADKEQFVYTHDVLNQGLLRR